MKKLFGLIILAFLLETTVVVRWLLACRDFASRMTVTSAQLSEYLTRDIHNEQHVPILLVRLFYNKLTASVFWGLKPYLAFFDLPFLVTLLSLIGCVGFVLGIWFVVSKKQSKLLNSIVPLILIIPLVEVLGFSKLPFLLRFLLIALPFEALSLYGLFALVQTKRSRLPTILIIVLLCLSLLFLFAFPTGYSSYCVGR